MNFQALDRKFGVVPKAQVLKDVRESGWFRYENRLFYVMEINGDYFALRIDEFTRQVEGVDGSREMNVESCDRPTDVVIGQFGSQYGVVSGHYRLYQEAERSQIEEKLEQLRRAG